MTSFLLVLQDKSEEVKKQKKEENGEDKDVDDEELVEGEEDEDEELGEDEEELDEGEGEAEGINYMAFWKFFNLENTVSWKKYFNFTTHVVPQVFFVGFPFASNVLFSDFIRGYFESRIRITF